MGSRTKRPPLRTPYTGTRIMDVARARGLTARDLGRLMDVDESLIGRVSRGERAITRRFVAAAVSALGMPADQLFFSATDIPSPMGMKSGEDTTPC